LLGMGNSQVIAVPLSAVRTDRAQPYVQVVETAGNQQQVAHKTVTLGVRGMDLARPESEPLVGVTGLAEGSVVLKGAVGALREGLVVTYTRKAPDVMNAASAASATSTPASASSAP
jgi:hypothetical protein